MLKKNGMKTGVLLAAVVLAAGAAVWLTRRDDTDAQATPPGPFEYDLQPLRRVDPETIVAREIGAVQIPHDDACALAVDPTDRIHVATTEAVLRFSTTGMVENRIALPSRPTCLAVDADGTTFVGFRTRVEIFGADGQRAAMWPAANDQAVYTSIALAPEDVFIADAGNRIVLRYNRSGTLLNALTGDPGPTQSGGFIVPSACFDLALGRQGTLWIVNPGQLRLEEYAYDGDPLGSWGTPSMTLKGFCGCCNPSHLAITANGRFVTSEKGLDRVKIYGNDGAFIGLVVHPNALAGNPEGVDLAVNSRDQILLLDAHRRQVRIFAAR